MNDKQTNQKKQRHCICGACLSLDSESHRIGALFFCSKACKIEQEKAMKNVMLGWKLQGISPIFIIKSASDYDFSHLIHQTLQQESATA